MGLDMFLNKKKEKEEPVEIGYWRKHPNLHGYIEKIYRERGGKEEFNCIEIELTKNDIEKIIEATKNDSIEKTVGFFFGESNPLHKTETLEIMKNALKEIDKGYKIFYDSWW